MNWERTKCAVMARCFFVFTCLGSASCANTQSEYVAAPTKGWVVDTETKQPVEGAVVVAYWRLEGGLHFEKNTTMMALEAVTDKNGYYEIPGWGPLRNPVSYPLRDRDPVLYVFKRGFYLGVFNNDTLGVRPASQYDPVTKQDVRKGRERFSKWDGKKLQIPKPMLIDSQGVSMPLKKWIESDATNKEGALENIIRNYPYDDENRNCFWKNLRRAFVEVHLTRVAAMEYSAQFEAATNYGTVISNLPESSPRMREIGCPSPREVFKEYLK